MRIKKIRQSLGAIGNVADSYTTDSNACYNAPYVNNLNTYSTDEIRIGTWIDNKPLYRKVFLKDYTAGTTTDSMSTGLSNVDRIASMRVIIQKGATSPDYEGTFYASSSDWARCFYRGTDNSLQFRSASYNIALRFYVILEYTKTTD